MFIADPILVLTTGGTIDKLYFDALSQYQVGESVIARLLELGRVTHPFRLAELMRKDSLDLDDADRAAIAANTRDRIRITRTAWLDSIAENKWIYDRIQQITTMINAMSYRFELTGFFRTYPIFGLSRYRGGHYDWHVDQGPLVTRRKLSLSVQLTDLLHYQGGDLQFLAGSRLENAPRDRGMVIAFPSYGVHRVAPVTSGTRKSLVIWITGPQFR
jgi:PKHD-type hydroxylase